jgi:hypothetical protein
MKTLFTLLLTCLLVLPVNAKYSGGTGESNDPYQIATAADLIALGETPEDYDKHFILTADIDLDPNLPSGQVFQQAVIPAFTGVFDGNDRTISHLTIKGGSSLGLFGRLGDYDLTGEVRNLGLEAVEVSGTGSFVGGLAGSIAQWGTISHCYSSGSVHGGSFVGGLLGSSSNCEDYGGNITDCWSDGVVTGGGAVGGLVGANNGWVGRCHSAARVMGSGWYVGGLVGLNDNPFYGTTCGGAVTESYSTGAVSGVEYVGGLVGYNPGWIAASYSTGAVTGSGWVGGLVGDNMWGSVVSGFWDIQTSGQTTSVGGTGKTTAEMQDPNTFMLAGWDFVGQPDGPHDIWAQPEGGGYPILAWQLSVGLGLPTFSGGTGEPDDPYLISTAQELNSIGHNPRLMNCHFRLIQSLDLMGVQFHPIGDPDLPYAGVFDGSGHKISHLTVTGESHLGLFGALGSGGTVSDLGVLDVNVIGSGSYIAGLVGQNVNGLVTQCYCTGLVIGRGTVGGLVGINGSWDPEQGGKVTHCYSTGAVSGTYWSVGGLVGDNRGTITTSYSTGAVGGASGVGGLAGGNSGSITDCSSTGSVNGTDYVGGLVGHNVLYGRITTSCSAGPVTGDYHVGGLAGYNDGRITDCYSTGSVSGDSNVGGLVGGNSGSIVTSYGSGSVSGTDDVGGLVGSSSVRVTSNFWDTDTSGQATSAGGTGKTTAEMQTASTFLDAGWDFVGETANGTEDIWWILEGKDYPRLWWEVRP